MENDYLYSEGDIATTISFLNKGDVGFVLPKYNNVKYINVDEGAHFGIIDIMCSIIHCTNVKMDNWIEHKGEIRRFTTIMAMKESTLLTMEMAVLFRLKQEFSEIYNTIYEKAIMQAQKVLTIKVETILLCEEARVKHLSTCK